MGGVEGFAGQLVVVDGESVLSLCVISSAKDTLPILFLLF